MTAWKSNWDEVPLADALTLRARMRKMYDGLPSPSDVKRRARMPVLLKRSRNLLRHAVDRAQAPDEFATIERYDLAVGELFTEDPQRRVVLGDAKSWHENPLVHNVEIAVARWKTLLTMMHLWHGYRDAVGVRQSSL